MGGDRGRRERGKEGRKEIERRDKGGRVRKFERG